MTGERGSRGPSFAVLALGVAGSAVAVLGVVVLAVWILPVGPGPKAAIALVGVIVAIAAMGGSSRVLTQRAIEREFGPHGPDDDATAPADPSGPARGDRGGDAPANGA